MRRLLALWLLTGFAAYAAAGYTYVPLDSWIYPALERLADEGLIPSQITGLRPWTRAECERQVREAERSLADGEPSPEVVRALAALKAEFEPSRTPVSVESVSVRAGVIAGPALTDSFHFGQTWINDSGRPFGRGWNGVAGTTIRAESGRFFAGVSSEYQHAPAATNPTEVSSLIARLDGIPAPAAAAPRAVDRFRPIEAYAGVRLGNFSLSAGRQATWWGPTYDAPLSWSSNAEPPLQLRLSALHPIRLPGPLRLLGSVRGELALGRLGGHQWPRGPWFNAQKVSFKLTDNLEMGFTRWSLFWGEGHPVTVGSFVRNFASLSSRVGDGGARDPGDRKGGFDFRYRLPGLRRWVTLYSDSYSDDDPSPLAAPRRAAINPGIHIVQFPFWRRLDLRVEAPSTTPLGGDHGGRFNYYNTQYRNGNTNYGYLVGSWAGRNARVIEAWAGVTGSPRERIELGWRHLKGGARFLPGGSTQTAGSMRIRRALSHNSYAELFLQYERSYLPVLGGERRNASGWLRLTWEPRLPFAW